MKQRERFYEIDLFRFLAAMSVVFYHYTFRGYAADDMSSVYFPYLADISKYGFLGIDLFFMISGFVILLTAMHKDFKGFVISRITRLYPAFWAAVTLTALAIIVIGGDKYSVGFTQYIANLSMVSGYFGVKPIDDVYWTLLVEISFYVLIGIIVLANQIRHIKYYLLFWLFLTALTPYVHIPSVVRILFILDWSSYFIAGSVLYLIRKEGISALKIAMLAASYYLSLRYTGGRISVLGEYYQTEFSFWIVSAIITFFYIIMFLVAIKKTDMINKKIMMSLGVLTYPLYLIHENIGFMLLNIFGDSMNRYVLLAMVISFMLLVAYLMNRYIENTFSIKLKNLISKFVK